MAVWCWLSALVLIMSACPVDHSSLQKTSQAAPECPVDHTTRSSWRSFLPFASSKPDPPPSSSAPVLSTSREVSSIPNAAGSNWVYPSEAQFFDAMARKNHNPEHNDMAVVVPIHNAVNERAWAEIQKWERGRGGDKCGGVKLVSFKGKPNELSPKARWKTLLGCILHTTLPLMILNLYPSQLHATFRPTRLARRPLRRPDPICH